MWNFRQSSYEDTIAESKLGEFFSGAPSEGIIREAFQNSLDAVYDPSKPVRISITFGSSKTSEFPEAYQELGAHWGALGQSNSTGGSSNYLLMEDFNTTGLQGPVDKEEEPHGSLYSFWWEEGRSKKRTGSGGSHGVGKSTLSSASQLNAFLALSIRDKEPESEILIGYCILPPHEIQGTEYLGYARFGNRFDRTSDNESIIHPYLANKPEENTIIQNFRKHAGLLRDDEKGLSIFIPRIKDEVNRESVLLSIIRNFFFPIIKENLVVELRDSITGVAQKIDKTSIVSIAEQVFAGQTNSSHMMQLIRVALEANQLASKGEFFYPKAGFSFSSGTDLTSDAFTDHNVDQMQDDFQNGKVVALRLAIPIKLKGGELRLGYVDLYAKGSDGQGAKSYKAFRGDILIGREKCRASQPFETVIMDIFNDTDGNELSEYMKYAEDPGHTEWKNSPLRRCERYAPTEHWQRHLLQRLAGSFVSILSGTEDKAKIDNFADDIFYIERELPLEEAKRGQGKRGKKKGPKKSDKPDIPPPTPQIFGVRQNNSGRAVVYGTDNLAEVISNAPEGKISGKVWAANVIFGKSKQNWRKQHHEADFDFRREGMIEADNSLILEVGANVFEFETDNPDFEIRLSGFDPNRDVHIDVRKLRELAE